jgi:ABC-2 type transport system ATP-binding protein
VLVTTHYLDEAEHCHRVAIIHAGKMAALGSTRELKGVFKGRTILEVQSPDPVQSMKALDALTEVQKTSIFGTAVHAVVRAQGAAAEQIVRHGLQTSGVVLNGLAEVEPSLEDVFLDVVAEAS